MEPAKALYVALADHIATILGQRPLVPHEHYDPVKHAGYTPEQVKAAEKRIVTQETGFLLVIALDPSWGGGIEVGWAEDRGIPVLTMWPTKKKYLSRLLRGCSNAVVGFDSYEEALVVAETVVRDYFQIPKEAAA